MGYFDALTSSSFRTAEDGRRLFFPWGTLGRGYLIPSLGEFERLQRHVKGYMMVSLPIAIAAVTWKGFNGGLLVLPVLILPYLLWTWAQCRHLCRTDERLTLAESVASQARAHSTATLWLLTVIGGTFVVLGAGILILDRENWLLAAGAVAFFGGCTVMSGWMLVAKRRQAADER